MVSAAKKPRASTRQARVLARVQDADECAGTLLGLIEGEKRARIMSTVPAFRAVPTIIRSFNRATAVGGVPLSNVLLLHGPSGGGKTAFAMALIASFQRVGGLAALVDAEHAAETQVWFPRLVDTSRCAYYGRAPEKHLAPWTYEEIVGSCDRLIERFRDGKKEGRIGPSVPLIVVVDSISKMVPASLLKRLKQKGGEGLSSGVGRLQAMLNTAWLAELGPKVGDEDILFVVIAHELEVAAPNAWAQDYKVRGGGALVYDAMMACRVTYAGRVFDSAAEKAAMVGKRHRVKVTKNKHGPGWSEATFFVSTGLGIAEVGFDGVREIVQEAMLRGLVKGPAGDGGKRALTLGTRLEYAGEKFPLRALFEKRSELVDVIGRALDDDLFETRKAPEEDA
jgi:recombination protein RecA